MSALLVLSLAPFAAGVGGGEISKHQQVCQVGDGKTCEDSLNLLDESNEALSLMQRRMSVKAHTGSAAGSRRSNEVTNLVQDVISMYKENGGKLTPKVKQFLEDVLRQITDDVVPKIKEEHDAQVSQLAAFLKAVQDTDALMEASEAKSKTAKGIADGARTKLTGCRGDESTIHGEVVACRSEEATKLSTKNAKSQEVANTLKGLRSMFSDDPSVEDMLKPQFRSSLARQLDTFKTQNAALDVAINEWVLKKKECDDRDADLSTKKGECDRDQLAFEMFVCTHAQGIKDGCAGYATAYKGAAATFNQAKATAEIMSEDRKVEYTGLMHAQCLLKAIQSDTDGSLTQQKINDCQSAAVDASHLNIVPADTPDEKVCEAMPPYPCTTEFETQEYGTMPSGTVKAACVTCTPPID